MLVCGEGRMTVPESVIERIVERMARAAVDASEHGPWNECSVLLKDAVRREQRAALTALYTALGEEGWQVVPRGVTSEMAEAARRPSHELRRPHNWSIEEQTWSRMLSAAPPPPGSTGESLF
jgi:hypothetical protein